MNVPSPTRRYLAVWLRRLSTDRLARRSGVRDEAPHVVAAPIKSALRITAVDDAAARLGLNAGMALADARAMYPHLKVTEADPHADALLLEAVADWCDRYTPLVGLDPPDGLMLDITGCAHLFGGEAALCRDLVHRLEAQGLRTRAAISDTVGCAWGIARHGKGGVIAPGDTLAALQPLPLAALRLAPETVAALAQMSLKTVADVLARPRAPLAARFGTDLVRRLDQALGRETESIQPRKPLPCYVAEQRFAEPIALEADVLGILERLAGQLAARLEQHGEGARFLEAVLFRVDGKVLRLSAATSRPVRDPALVRRLFADRLSGLGDEADPGFGFDLLRLSVVTAERLDVQQIGFGADDHGDDVARLIDRLGVRFGLASVRRFTTHDTHIPEYATTALPAHLVKEEATAPLLGQDSLAPARPLHLFAQPEPIEAIAEVPDGPPARFRWRRVMHEVAVAEGPERIAMEWWRDAEGRTLTRDYFRVEDQDGARFWLYREGLFQREVTHPRWFLHGLFA